jgi:hypothetical protein
MNNAAISTGKKRVYDMQVTTERPSARFGRRRCDLPRTSFGMPHGPRARPPFSRPYWPVLIVYRESGAKH